MCKKLKRSVFGVLLATGLSMTVSSVCGGTGVKNGAFRDGPGGMDHWTWKPGSKEVHGRVIQQAGLDQGNVFAVSSLQAELAPPSVLSQEISGLKSGTGCIVSVWVKGKSVGRAQLFIGDHVIPLPEGDYDWRKIEGDFQLPPETSDPITAGVRTFGRTGELWVVHLRVSPAESRQAEALKLLDKNRERLNAVKSGLKKESFSTDAYLRMGLAIAEFYVARVESGGPNGLQGLPDGVGVEDEAAQWSLLQMKETADVLNRTEARMERLRSGEVGVYERQDLRNGKISYDSAGFLFTPEGGKPRSVVLGGFGHFEDSVNDAAFLGELGSTFSQGERGPWDTDKSGNPDAKARSMPADIEKKFSAGIRTDMLLSPHYFPKWVIQKYPDLRLTPESEKQTLEDVNINHPVYVETITNWINSIIPIVLDSPGLFSFCITNEPGYEFSGRDSYSRPLWISYLEKKHGTIQTLNDRYGTKYESFEEVPVPDRAYPKDPSALPAYYDWVRFNQQNVADWHRWMNDLVKRAAPNIPTHVKYVMDHFDPRPQAERTHGGVLAKGIDPEIISEFTDLAGTDTVAFIGSEQGRYSFPWQRTELTYDFMHSIRQRPVIDSELHFIIDGHPAESIPAEHLRLVLWLGALHNRTAFVNWIWSEPGGFSTSGSVKLRPASLFGASEGMLDLNRLAEEVRAVNEEPAKVALLYSPSLLFWQENYPRTLIDLYTALSFAGYKVTFISEKQLAENTYSKQVKTLFLPHATHVSDETVANLKRFADEGGKIVAVGNDNLAFNEYNQPRKKVSLPKPIQISASRVQATNVIKEAMSGFASPPPVLMDKESNSPAWGVEYRVIRKGGKELISVVNLLNGPVRLGFEGKGTRKDLVSGRQVNTADFTMQPREFLMLKE